MAPSVIIPPDKLWVGRKYVILSGDRRLPLMPSLNPVNISHAIAHIIYLDPPIVFRVLRRAVREASAWYLIKVLNQDVPRSRLPLPGQSVTARWINITALRRFQLWTVSP